MPKYFVAGEDIKKGQEVEFGADGLLYPLREPEGPPIEGWTCCGMEMDDDERCKVCGDRYES